MEVGGEPSFDPVELVRLEIDERRHLDGALYPADSAGPVPGVLLLHGKGSNFYSGTVRSLPPLLRRVGYTCLAWNMTCHDLGYSLTGGEHEANPWGAPKASGGMWEDLASGHEDVALGLRVLAGRCDGPLVVVGHSSGGWYALDYVLRGGVVDGLVLLSPVLTSRGVFASWFREPSEEGSALEQARDLVETGKGHTLVPLPSWWYAISARSLVERAEEDPDRWLAGLRTATTPLLMAWGTAEPRRDDWAAAFASAAAPNKVSIELLGAGHHYEGFEQRLADGIATFVDSLPVVDRRAER